MWMVQWYAVSIAGQYGRSMLVELSIKNRTKNRPLSGTIGSKRARATTKIFFLANDLNTATGRPLDRIMCAPPHGGTLLLASRFRPWMTI